MSVAFYNPISDSFHKSICEASNFDEQVDSCIENIYRVYCHNSEISWNPVNFNRQIKKKMPDWALVC